MGMDILGPLPNSEQVIHFSVVKTDRSAKFLKLRTSSDTNNMTVAHIFLEHGVASYGILSKPFSNKSSQLLLKLFVAMCITLGVNNIITTKYHPQTNGEKKQFNSILIS